MRLKRKVTLKEMCELADDSIKVDNCKFYQWIDKIGRSEFYDKWMDNRVGNFCLQVIFVIPVIVYTIWKIKKACNENNWSIIELSRQTRKRSGND